MRKGFIFTVAMLLLAGSNIANAKGASGGHTGGGSHSSHSHSTSTGTGTGSKMESSHVKSYNKTDGTHVDQHKRSTRDETKLNNWSTKGNVNPDTGKLGTKPAY